MSFSNDRKDSPSGQTALDRIAKYLFVLCLAGLVWLYGVFAHKYEIVPYPQLHYVLEQAKLGVNQIRGQIRPEESWFFYRRPPEGVSETRTYLPDAVSSGPVLVYGMGENRQMMIRIMENSGEIIHQWDIDAFELWPDMSHVPEATRPKSRPGGELHGLEIMPDGDLVFNIEPLGLTRLGFCGDVVWRLPRFTHHSVHRDESGVLFVSEHPVPGSPVDPAEKFHINDEAVLEVSEDGDIINRTSVVEILQAHDLQGLLYLSSIAPFGVNVNDSDVLHMNDVEPFPSHLEPGVFQRGDVMVSLRNLNTIMVFNMQSRAIKYLYTGTVVMQHDPDFISGNEISIFDNHSLVGNRMERTKRPDDVASRIVILDARDNSVRVHFQGSKYAPFFTDIMGKHQWLPNGNVLITESRWGRVFEITPDGQLAWEFNNVLKQGSTKGLLGMIAEGRRLPPEFDRAKLEALKSACAFG